MLEKLKEYAVFSVNDIKKLKEYKNIKSPSVLLHRLKAKNRIVEIERGKYSLINDPYVIATNIIMPSYLSFWSCSYYLGFTEQVVNTIQIACSVQKKSILIANQQIEFIKIRPRLMFGFKREKNGMFIATDEKLVIDCLLYQKHLGNFEEIIKVIENCTVEREIVIDYLQKIKNISLIKRVGYLFEKYKSIDVYKEFEKEVKRDANYIWLDASSKGKVRNTKWRVWE